MPVTGDYLTLLNISIATIAVIISYAAVSTNRRQRRLEAFFKIQEFLLEVDIQKGRRLIYEATRRGTLPTDENDFYLIVRALANFNTAAELVHRGVIPKKWALEHWHHGLQDMRTGYDSVVKYRLDHWQTWNAWPSLGLLISDAENYKSKLLCCSSGATQRKLDPRHLLTGGPPPQGKPTIPGATESNTEDTRQPESDRDS